MTECKWTLICTNEANGTKTHPILGEVPICDIHREMDKRFAETLGTGTDGTT